MESPSFFLKNGENRDAGSNSAAMRVQFAEELLPGSVQLRGLALMLVNAIDHFDQLHVSEVF